MASTSERSKFTSKSMMRTVTLHKESRHVKLGIQFFSKWDVDRRAKKLTSDEQQILEQSAIVQEPPTNGPAAGLFYPGERIVLINNFLVQDPHDAARQLGSASGDVVIQVLPAFEGFDLSKPFDELPNASLAGSSGLSKATKEALRVLLHGLAPPTTVSQDKPTMPALNCMGSPPLSPPLSPQLSPPPGKILASARRHRDAQREAQQAMQFVRTHKLNHSELSNAKAVPKKEKESTLFKSFIDKVSKGQLFGKAAKTRSKASATPIVASPPVSNRPDSAVSSAVPSAVPSAQSSARGRMHSLISVMLEDADHVDDELEEKEEETSMVETQAAQHLSDLQRPASRVRAIFSDLDGTIVHFPAWFEEHGIKIVSRDEQAKRAVVESPTGEQRVCRLLPSSTMGDGLVSERTVELIAELRARGVIFVIVTAARKSTLFEREPLLPPSDAYVCETGSRIYRGGLDALDEAWAKGFEEVSGPLERELDVSERPEPLWQLFRRFQAEVPGLKCDARSYYGCFRVDTQGNTAVEAALRACIEAHLPHGITWAMNLGKYDFFPSASGKGNAVAYLQAVYGVRADESCCLFDDDNDLPMAERCAVHYLPGLTSQSVSRAAAEHPEWHVASKAGQGVFAIEECLEQLLERVVREQEGGTVDVEGGGGSGVAAPTASKGPAAAISS